MKGFLFFILRGFLTIPLIPVILLICIYGLWSSFEGDDSDARKLYYAVNRFTLFAELI